jgi:hypothetical protein
MDGAHQAGFRGLEIVVALVISTAGLASSFAAYESELWKGKQTLHLGRSSVARVAATRAALEASVNRTVEVDLFDGWLKATEAGDTRLASLYVQRFPPEFRQAFDGWRAQGLREGAAAPRTPFGTPAYRARFLGKSDDLEARADKEFADGQVALRRSEEFGRAAAVLALSMFCGGIGQAFSARGPRLVLAVSAGITCALGLALIVSLPMLRLH